MDSRLDVIQEPKENENVKTTIEELEAVILFAQWPERKVYVGANLSQDMKGDHISHLSDTFQVLWKFNMKLNPEKCAFDVASGKFLGFLVSNYGIEVNPTQIKAIEEIPDKLTIRKKMQRLTGRIAALGRFISESSEKCIKFFSALRKQDQFEWTEELKNLKAYLSNPPLLAKPKAGERLLIYLVVSEVAVSVVLVCEDQGRLAKWAIELSEYDIAYHPRTAIKSQVLADFVVDFSQGMQLEAEKELQVFNGSNSGIWTLFTDGSSNVKGAGLGIVLVPPRGETIRQAIKYHSITNNKAEYEAGSTDAAVLREGMGSGQQFQTWKVMQISRDKNVEADALANLASAIDVAGNESASYGTIPEDKKKAHALRKKAARYCLNQDNLYRKMFGGPLARCRGPSQTEYVMREIHEGHCGNYAGGRSLVRTMNKAGYY
ncbi:uncharacterized protein [Nicotiana sylvestris]|uniref:uncharacterized protein n=1 Tax=Nicotiana sylvestris TaxID=4096 RepID=UPI00388C5C87